MCCDIHQKYPYLLVIGKFYFQTLLSFGTFFFLQSDKTEIDRTQSGMFDGNVAVYNLESNPTQPMYVSKGTDGKHSNIVWEVKWGADMQDGELNFFSISGDGMIYNWVLDQLNKSIYSFHNISFKCLSRY